MAITSGHIFFLSGLWRVPFFSCLSAGHRFWSHSFCAPVLQQHLLSGFFESSEGRQRWPGHCCIDRYSNYNLLHSVPISIQHQLTLSNSHYTLAKWNKSPTFNGSGTQNKTLTPRGVRHQIVSWSLRLQNTVWLLIYGCRVGCRISRRIILGLARVHSKALAWTGSDRVQVIFKRSAFNFYGRLALECRYSLCLLCSDISPVSFRWFVTFPGFVTTPLMSGWGDAPGVQDFHLGPKHRDLLPGCLWVCTWTHLNWV